MPLNPPRLLQSAFSREYRYQSLTLILCVLFGIAIIANTLLAGDAATFWYASFLHSGLRLYSGMHLALQPLFVLETASFLGLLGKGWLVSKVPAVLHLVAYCIGLFLLARSSRLSDRQKALILACVFFASIDFGAYRFDDYHVLADCFQVYSLVVLLALQKTSQPWQRYCLAVILGLLTGLSLMNRLNDGAALFAGVAIAILFLSPSGRLLSLALFSVMAALTVVLVVRLTGDSLHDWATYSIFKAAGSKGGAGNILAYPLQLPWNALRLFGNSTVLLLVAYLLGAALIWVALIRPFWRTRQPGNLLRLIAGTILVLLPFHYLGHHLLESIPILAFPPLGVLLAYALGLAVVGRTLGQRFAARMMPPWDPREILLLIPLGQLASGSMSSGGSPLGLNGPLAIVLLLLPIASPVRLQREPVRAFAFAALTVLAVASATYKYMVPFQWHSYTAGPMFVGRQWYRHPDYGPMVIERDQLAFIQPICSAVQADGALEGLLSLPYPYANYFCSIQPWHGYVQTFYDTSGKQTIQTLIGELQTAPPKWIVYQRQPYNMGLHEQIFNHGQPLPHRALDQLIEDRIATGAWQTIYTSTYGSNVPFADQWLLIRTR